MSHIPVLLTEVIEVLNPQDNKVYVDATFGGGGYSRAILKAANCHVVAFDRDSAAITRGKEFERQYPDRFTIIQGCFSQIEQLFPKNLEPEAIVFDCGVSSYQLEEAARGFSFRIDGPLDMRMNQNDALTAEKVVNTYSESDLTQIILHYGEDRNARKIAKAIVESRQKQPILTTKALAAIVRSNTKGRIGLDAATLTFQALRIFVNNELMEIEQGLVNGFRILPIGGKLLTVTFQALEDMTIKQFVRNVNKSIASNIEKNAILKQVLKKPIVPSRRELLANPRSRSAKLRAYYKSYA